METLTLTSPNTEGAAVRHAQQLLAKNKYGKFHTEEIDGIFGPEAARSCNGRRTGLATPRVSLIPHSAQGVAAKLKQGLCSPMGMG